MQAPPAGIIEAAKDQLADHEYWTENAKILASQSREIRVAVPGKTDGFYAGYMLGMQAARLMLQTIPMPGGVDL